MTIRKALLASLLASTMLAGCNGSDDKKSPPADTVSQGIFDQLKQDNAQLTGTVQTLSERLAALR